MKLSTPQKHQKKVSIKTLRMSDVGVMIMGGQTKQEAREFLASIGWTNERIGALEL